LDTTEFKDCFVDGKNDGGVDLITTNGRDGQNQLVLIQSKYVENIGNQEIIDVFTKMEQTVNNFLEHRTGGYNARLRRVFKEKKSSLEDEGFDYHFVLFTKFAPDSKRREVIREELDTIDSLKEYQLDIIYGDMLAEQIQNVQEPVRHVKEGRVKYSKNHGVIKYGENGILIDVSANSLRDLYDRYKNHGLFEQNFRYFVRNKRIDDRILQSLHNKRQSFWFLNNGIIIACKDFSIDGDIIKLYEFSIVNGCQTTTLIGDFKSENEGNDFVLPCKIVKPDSKTNYDDFVADIGEASNSQKPISDRDLRSNREEQRQLQKRLKEGTPEIYLEIKRGETLLTPARKRNLQPWQYLTNEAYGQYVLAFCYQQPGTARSSKAKVFSDDATYKTIFRSHLENSSIAGILQLNYELSRYTDMALKTIADLDQENVLGNGRFIILACIGFLLAAVKRKQIDIKKIVSEDDWEKELTKGSFKGIIFKEPKIGDFETILDSLFSDLVLEISSLYQGRVNEEKTVSNFFKTDKKYRNVILKHLISRYVNNKMKANELDKYLNIFA